MKRRKKKNTSQQQKQEFRHIKNEFFKKLKQVAAVLGDISGFKLLNKSDLDHVFYCRIRPYKIINPNKQEENIGNLQLRVINKYLSTFLNLQTVEVGKSKTKISLYDFSVYAETLHQTCRNFHIKNPKDADQFRESFPILNDDFATIRVDVLHRVNIYINMLAWMCSDFIKDTVHFSKVEIGETTSPFDTTIYHNDYSVELKRPKTELLSIDGHKRTIYQVSAKNTDDIVDLTITPEKLGASGLMQKLPLKVFIQKHVLTRLEERLGCLFVRWSYPFVVLAVLGKAIPAETENSFLFPFKHTTTTLGYLKGDIIGDKLVIRTFLFLTNNGTPEGKKLQKLIGLEKADKKYLGIDKLSTFILSDIKDDQQLKDLFCRAGCGDLFMLDKSLLSDPNKNQTASSDFIKSYLGIQQ